MKLLKQIKTVALPLISIATIGINPVVAQNSFAEIEPMEFSSDELGVPTQNTYYQGFGIPTEVINWNTGERLEDILRLQDFNSGLGNLNLATILNSTGASSQDFSLADFKVLENTTFEQLANAIPVINSQKLADIEPLYQVVAEGMGNYTAQTLANNTIGQILEQQQIANLSLNQINLENYSLDSIPNLTNTSLNSFANWGNQSISDIPNLSNMPFDVMFSFLGVNIPIAKIDIVLGNNEGYINNTISGSYQEGFAVNCEQDNCKYIELVTYLPDFTGFDGKRWIGNSQFVNGGSGCFVGVEPTGRHPFGDNFKVVLTNVNEAEGRADFSMYFRFCFFCGCSPYFVGPIPFFSLSEKDPIFIGF